MGVYITRTCFPAAALTLLQPMIEDPYVCTWNEQLDTEIHYNTISGVCFYKSMLLIHVFVLKRSLLLPNFTSIKCTIKQTHIH